jgi:cytokinin dehydrogenase
VYSDFEVFRRDQEMLISEMEDQLHTFDYIEGFVVMNNQDPINGLKSVPFSPDADQAVSAMSSSMLPAAAAASSVLYYLEAAVGYNLADVGPALENVKTLLQHPVDPSAFALHDLLVSSLRKKKKTCSSTSVI